MIIKMICRVLIIVIYSLALGITIAKHGEPKEGEYDAVTDLISVAIIIALMIGAGTFS